jgi:phage gp36-like protein
MARITQAQLEAALGGAPVLVQLLDKDGDGIADAASVTEVLDYSEGEVNSAIQVAVSLDDAVVATSKVLQQRQLAIAVYWAWQRGTQALAMPDEVRAAYQDALRWLDDVAGGRRTLGISTAPAGTPNIKKVNIDPDSTRTTRANLKGFA